MADALTIANSAKPDATTKYTDLRSGSVSVVRRGVLSALFLLLAVVGGSGVGAQTEPGSLIDNVAVATFGAGGREGVEAFSNSLSLTVVVARTPARLEFLRYAPDDPGAEMVSVTLTDYSTTGTAIGPFLSCGDPVPVAGVPLDLSTPLTMVVEEVFHQNEPIFLRLIDGDQNLDYDLVETVLVVVSDDDSGEREMLRLTETGVNTGEFAGYVQSIGGGTAIASDGILTVSAEADIFAWYQDPAAPGDIATSEALVDPLGLVFDSSTGDAVDGVVLTLVDAATGLQAIVFGDDGVSEYPATITSGGSVTDAGGQDYQFSPGGYRYPWIAPGTYRLEVQPPDGYLAPSTVADADLQNLPGAPFEIDPSGSRGGDFVVVAGPPLRLDVPIDPSRTSLFVSKSASKTVVALGDFLQYEIRVANRSDATAEEVTIIDDLPPGFLLQSGSVTIGGTAVADPELSSNRRRMTFHCETLAADAALSIRYVLAVDLGARPGEAINEARAFHAGLASNLARASVTVQEDVFGHRCLIVGRVAVFDCAADSLDDGRGLAGVRFYLEDGTSVISDEEGQYHFEDVEPGAHVVQMDVSTLPSACAAGGCRTNDHRAEHPFARFVDLQGGTLWRADFAAHWLDPESGSVEVEVAGMLQRDLVQADIHLSGVDVSLRNVRLSVLLPDNTTYEGGSSRLDSVSLADPEQRNGVLIYRLGDMPAAWRRTVDFRVRADSTATRAELSLGALLTFDTPTVNNQCTPQAQAVVSLVPEQLRIRQPEIVLRPHFTSMQTDLAASDEARIDSLAVWLADLQVINIRVIGHTDSQRVRPGHSVFADNYELGLGRARSVGNYLAEQLALAAGQITMLSKGPDEPLATNATPEGRALNRRVALQVWSEKIVYRLPDQPVRDMDRQTIATLGLRPGEMWPRPGDCVEEKARMPDFDLLWLERAEAGFEILWPPPEYPPPIPSLKIVARHDPSCRLELLVDGESVDKMNRDGSRMNSAGTVSLTRWAGVDLHVGDNLCEVVARDAEGIEVGRLSRRVHYSGPPVHVELVTARSKLIASGRDAPVVAVRLTDQDGYPAREGVIGEFSIEAPYEPQRLLEEADKYSRGSLGNRRPTYVIGSDGIALIPLEATTRTGEAILRFKLADHYEDVRAWLEPEIRDWVLVGLAEGTLGYNAVSGNLEDLEAGGAEENFYSEERLAFFARGRVKGKWLMTMAWDSRGRDEQEDEHSLFGRIDPDAFYTVYGDASVQRHEAASASKLYLKIERREFYALWGDFATGLTVTELSRYNRRLTGFKAGLHTARYDATVFAADSHHGYVREEIRGDGTSGLYRLSHRNLVANSDRVSIEVRNRFHNEVIVSERRLTRFIDYDLDFAAGTLFFKEAVFSQDAEFNPVFIVIEYESWDDDEAVLQAGGRGAVKSLDGAAEVGATLLHEGGVGTSGDLLGLDGRLDLNRSTRIEVEVAVSDTDLAGRRKAFQTEVVNRSGWLEAKAYYRRREEGFGLGQQRGGQDGMGKFGVDADWRATTRLKVSGQAYRQRNLVTDTERDLLEAKLNWNERSYDAHVGLRSATDRFDGGQENGSRQVIAGASTQVLQQSLRLRANHEQSFGGDNANADFPTRTRLGAEYQINPAVTVFADDEYTHGRGSSARIQRVGLKSTPWTGGQISSSLEQHFDELDSRIFRNAGLKQTWHLNERWSLDAGVDHAQVDGASSATVNPAVPSAAGGGREGFTAVSAGATCRGKDWLWSHRVEVRNAATEDKWALESGVFIEPKRDLGMQAGLKIFALDGLAGKHSFSDVQLGLAWRPEVSRWTVLQRFNYKTEDQSGGTFDLSNWRVVSNTNANWQAHQWLQIAGQYGAKYLRETIDSRRYSSFIDLIGVEGRYYFARRWDAGLRSCMRHSWGEGRRNLSLGVSSGMMVMEDFWLSVGYNFLGFRDADFSGGDFTAQGPFIRFRFRFNQESTNEMLR